MIAIAAVLVRVWLVLDRRLIVEGNAGHDAYLFVWQAGHIIEGLWLGEYNYLTLIKGPFLSIWMALVFYLGHTIFEISNGMILKSPVELDKSFTETRGASLFFALIPLAYLLFRLALMIVLAKFLWTEIRMKRFGKMLDFVRDKR